MDRNEVLRISKLSNFGGLTESDVNIILMNYCLEHKKPYYKTSLFIIKVLSDVRMLKHCFTIALEYYEKKFTICKLWSKLNLLNNQEQERQLLQIF